MAPESESITAKASEYIFALFREQLPPEYVYHTYAHTADVAKVARKISSAEGFSSKEREMVELAAWFHDAGYIKGREGHEDRSAEIASAFLAKNGYPAERIPEVRKCIAATHMKKKPEAPLERVLCDADLSHVGRKSFRDRSASLRVELEQTEGHVFSDLQWLQYTLEFLSKHKFYTKFAQKKYSAVKNENLVKLRSDLDAEVKKQKKRDKKESLKELEQKRKSEKRNQPERGIETMFRVTLRNHINLSAIADSKANTMLSINALIISIVVTVIMSQLETFPILVIPAAILLIVCLITISLATIATRPQVTRGTVTREMIEQRKANLLFFGNFYKMSQDEFEWGMNEMLQDREYLYGSMIKDFYSLGVVLAKKYKYLRLCYNFFMYGMIVSVLLFLIFFVYLWK